MFHLICVFFAVNVMEEKGQIEPDNLYFKHFGFSIHNPKPFSGFGFYFTAKIQKIVFFAIAIHNILCYDSRTLRKYCVMKECDYYGYQRISEVNIA